MKDKINPIGLKGYEITDRMKQLMGIQSITENKTTSVIELTKLGPDGNVYGIVRENHEYYIKSASKKKDLIAEDFSYIGGLANKKSEAYGSYAKALKHLNLKFNSLNEAYGKSNNINVFQDDNLVKEDISGLSTYSGPSFKNEGNLEGNPKSECCGKPIMDGKCVECGDPMHENAAFGDDEELTEVEQEVEDMLEEKVPVVKEHRLSIERALNDMSNIIDKIAPETKKKVFTIK